MLISEKRRNTPKLSREIMGLLCITAAIALFFFGFLYLTANAIASTYLLENDILLTEGQLLTLQGGIRSLSLLSAVLLFLALFLFLLGQKMAYLRVLTLHSTEPMGTVQLPDNFRSTPSHRRRFFR